MYFDDLMLKKKYTPTKSYCQSKLANLLFTKELARRLEGTIWLISRNFHSLIRPFGVTYRYGSFCLCRPSGSCSN